MTQTKPLREKFEENSATVAVIGQGYVGLPLALAFARAGFETIGIDVDEERVEKINRGTSYIRDVSDSELQSVRETESLRATADFEAVARADAVSICVPTPLRKTRDPDISYIRTAVESLRPHLERPCLIVLESTTYPGTTEELVVPMVAEDGELPDNLYVAFSPERVDPGNENWHIENTPKVVGGVDDGSTALAQTLYRSMIESVHPVPSATEAEMVKLLENTFRAVNIGLVNEMALMCDRMEIDIWEVIRAAETKPFGFMPFYPGPGIGGHCIPNDPTYLSWKAKSYDFYNRFIELATDINSNMPRFVVEKATRQLNEAEKSVKGSQILLVGMAYKPDVRDVRESPALDIWTRLRDLGAGLRYHDPHAPRIPELGGETSVDLSEDRLRETDLIIVCTDHSAVDYDRIIRCAGAVLDTRDCLPTDAPNVRKL